MKLSPSTEWLRLATKPILLSIITFFVLLKGIVNLQCIAGMKKPFTGLQLCMPVPVYPLLSWSYQRTIQRIDRRFSPLSLHYSPLLLIDLIHY